MPQSRKVYEAHLGFYDTVVAAFSQKSALAAWGSSTDLFRMGIARITTDPAKVKAALAKPDLVLRLCRKPRTRKRDSKRPRFDYASTLVGRF